VPRFGHTSDLAAVLIGENDVTYQDYLLGIIFVGALILGIIVFWMISLLLLKTCGDCGVAAGNRMREERNSCRYGVMRFLVTSCCVLSLVSGIVFLVRANTSLENTLDTVVNGVTFLSDQADTVTRVANDIIIAGDDANTTRYEAVMILEQGVCGFEGGNGNQVPDIDDKIETILDLLNNQLNDFAKDDLTLMASEYSTEFSTAQKETTRVVDLSKDYVKISWYAITVIVFSTLLSIGAYLAWFGPRIRAYFCLQTWVVLPVYFAVILISAVVLAVLGPVIVANSDVCLGGPDKNPESFLRTVMSSQNLSSYEQEVLNFYVFEGCQSSYSGLSAVTKLSQDLSELVTAVGDLKADLEESKGSIAVGFCQGTIEDLDPLIKALNDAVTVFSPMKTSANEAVGLLECEPINNIYVDSYRDGVCEDLPSTVSWMFATMTCIVFFGMGIFFLRGALLPSIEPSSTNDMSNDYYDRRTDKKPVSRRSSSGDKKSYRSKSSSRNDKDFASSSNADFSSGSDDDDDSMLLSLASTSKSSVKNKRTTTKKKKVIGSSSEISSDDEEWQSDSSSSDSSEIHRRRY
jgi:hypothetical protein